MVLHLKLGIIEETKEKNVIHIKVVAFVSKLIIKNQEFRSLIYLIQ